MGTVFGKNTTSSSITVAVHKVYYIDSTDAEIVGVQDGNNVKYNAFKYSLSGTPYWYVIDGEHDTWTDDLSAWGYSEVPVGPSVGDIITLGRYPQATSTPEDIEWVVLAVDTANHRALLVSKYALTARQFDVSRPYSGSYWGTSTLRTWLNGDFWNDAFTVYDQAAIILSDLDTNGTATQDHVFILAISDANDYFSNNSDRLCVATQYAINQNVYNTPAEHYAPWWLRTKDSTTRNDYAAFVESDGAVHADGYSATDTHFGIRPAIWFDYTVVVLPIVSVAGDFGQYNWVTPGSNPPVPMVADGVYNGYVDGVYPNYDSTKAYGVIQWQTSPGTRAGAIEVAIVSNSGLVALKNVSSSTINVYQAKVAVCSDSTATVVTVYNTSNVAYNAFKYTTNNTDYYYALDDTQTDWTDDLAGIGYSLTPNYLKGYINSSKGDSYVSRYSEKNLYDDTGNLIIGDSSKTYTIIGVYTANGGSVSYSNASLYAYENRLKFVWNDSNAYIAYVEYTVS